MPASCGVATSGGIALPGGNGKPLGLKSVACGLWHTAAVTDSGDLYTWGWGRFGQLGYSQPAEDSDAEEAAAADKERAAGAGRRPTAPGQQVDFVQSRPRLVTALEDEVVAVVAGSRHTGILVKAAPTRRPEASLSRTSDEGPMELDLMVFGMCGTAYESTEVGEGDTYEHPSKARRAGFNLLSAGPWHLVWSKSS